MPSHFGMANSLLYIVWCLSLISGFYIARRSMATAVVLLTSMIVVKVWMQYIMPKLADPYGLFHLELNESSGNASNAKTEWLNMGYWNDTHDFPVACRALALRTIAAAQLTPEGRVLDVGHGTGESLVLLLSDPSIPTLSHITGITSLQIHSQRTAARLANLQAAQEGEHPKVFLFCGDAIYRPDRAEAEGHPLRFNGQPLCFTSVIALDCAYHFNPRRTFLAQALAQLAPGGRIALADIAFSGKPPHFPLSVLLPMPQANMITVDRYVAQMDQLGYIDVKMEDITEDVFPGFVQFLQTKGLRWRAASWGVKLLQYTGARFIIVSGQRPIVEIGRV